MLPAAITHAPLRTRRRRRSLGLRLLFRCSHLVAVSLFALTRLVEVFVRELVFWVAVVLIAVLWHLSTH